MLKKKGFYPSSFTKKLSDNPDSNPNFFFMKKIENHPVHNSCIENSNLKIRTLHAYYFKILGQ
ncbi:hypothetical protein DRF65_27190 [Chryseobacterium pennae]|uniref:Uncharacterized protein n=1 Tax=Chryseobacterium pennae TaxID=2258962 RepID=A0A3D9C072_9FLAO|nr:hypothetical protein DRF65_27190 [Chryseobacterium pennae]